jgi:hypothetical protein
MEIDMNAQNPTMQDLYDAFDMNRGINDRAPTADDIAEMVSLGWNWWRKTIWELKSSQIEEIVDHILRQPK